MTATDAHSAAARAQPLILGLPLPTFAIVYSLFALGLSAALLAPEATTRIDLHRAIYSIWLSSLFATPAFVVYITRVSTQDLPDSGFHLWRLLWTFAGLAYFVHFAYVFFSLHRSDVASVFEVQTRFVASANFLFTAWWAIDLVLLWAIPGSRLQQRQNRVFQCFAFVVFVVAFIFLRPGVPQVLGTLMVVGVVASFIIRPSREVPT